MTFHVNKLYRVELYFVLYLFALLLLLPDKEEDEGTNFEPILHILTQQRIYLIPEKNTLTLTLDQHTEQWYIRSADTVNAIHILGDAQVQRLSCSVALVGSEKNLIYTSSTPSSSLPFHIALDTQNRRISFQWLPSKFLYVKPQSFQVKIVVFAKPLLPQNIRDNEELSQQLAEWVESHRILLRDSVEFFINYAPFSSQLPLLFASRSGLEQTTPVGAAERSSDFSPPAIVQPITILPIDRSGPIALRVEHPSLHTLAGEQWGNTILISGIRSKRALPNIHIICTPRSYQRTIQYKFLDSTTVLIRGEAPRINDSMEVEVRIEDTQNDVSATTSFFVYAHPLPEPQIPSVMYPEITYPFYPNFPLLSISNIRAILRENGQIRYTSIRGEPFEFTPQNEDTNKTFIFERYIRSEKVGETYLIKVLPYPPPKIIEVLPGKNEYYIRVQSFGYFQGIPNRSKLEVRSGKATIQERFGDYIFSKDNHLHIQTFVVKPQGTNPVQIQAVDQRNHASQLVTIP